MQKSMSIFEFIQAVNIAEPTAVILAGDNEGGEFLSAFIGDEPEFALWQAGIAYFD